MIDWILAHPAEAALAALGTTTSIAMAIRVLIPALSAVAAKTATKADDEAVTRLASGLDWLIVALDAARRVLPRVVVGPLPSNQPIATAATSVPPMKSVSMPPPGPEIIQPVRFVGDDPRRSLTHPNAPPPPPKEPRP
jgi:hypothetical protein